MPVVVGGVGVTRDEVVSGQDAAGERWMVGLDARVDDRDRDACVTLSYLPGERQVERGELPGRDAPAPGACCSPGEAESDDENGDGGGCATADREDSSVTICVPALRIALAPIGTLSSPRTAPQAARRSCSTRVSRPNAVREPFGSLTASTSGVSAC